MSTISFAANSASGNIVFTVEKWLAKKNRSLDVIGLVSNIRTISLKFDSENDSQDFFLGNQVIDFTKIITDAEKRDVNITKYLLGLSDKKKYVKLEIVKGNQTIKKVKPDVFHWNGQVKFSGSIDQGLDVFDSLFLDIALIIQKHSEDGIVDLIHVKRNNL